MKQFAYNNFNKIRDYALLHQSAEDGEGETYSLTKCKHKVYSNKEKAMWVGVVHFKNKLDKIMQEQVDVKMMCLGPLLND
jgi:hypothetical protein